MINFERLIYMRQPFLRKVLTGILMRELSQRTSQFTDSVIRRMTRVANKYGAVNLSQGFPDFDPPEAITDRLAEVAGEGPHQYALTWGAKNFRDALAAKQEHFSGMKIDAESEIVVTCGSTEAMMAAMMSVVNPGDKVIIFSPFYENYGADTILSGAEPVYVPLVPPEFKFDANVLEDAFKTGAKALILCKPSNTCGKVFTEEELKDIVSKLASDKSFGEVLRAKGIVASDEGEWFHFDLVPEETELRRGAADYTGRICVIGSNLNEAAIKELFHVA